MWWEDKPKQQKESPEEKLHKQIRRLYLSGWTTVQIAKRVNLPVAEVERRLPEVKQSLKSSYKMM